MAHINPVSFRNLCVIKIDGCLRNLNLFRERQQEKSQVDGPMLGLLAKMSVVDFPQCMPGLVMLNTKVNLEIVHC